MMVKGESRGHTPWAKYYPTSQLDAACAQCSFSQAKFTLMTRSFC